MLILSNELASFSSHIFDPNDNFKEPIIKHFSINLSVLNKVTGIARNDPPQLERIAHTREGEASRQASNKTSSNHSSRDGGGGGGWLSPRSGPRLNLRGWWKLI